jgi:hypothetical protein
MAPNAFELHGCIGELLWGVEKHEVGLSAFPPITFAKPPQVVGFDRLGS